MANNSTWRKAQAALERIGFRTENGKKHRKLFAPDGTFVSPIPAGSCSGDPRRFLEFRKTVKHKTGIDVKTLLAILAGSILPWAALCAWLLG